MFTWIDILFGEAYDLIHGEVSYFGHTQKASLY
jgi:hypothetical protein